ncbi:MAG: transposase [Pseudobdellovibrionaceae bacterium]|nr:transposase [Pseudobdellovibrionaceae bacterium]
MKRKSYSPEFKAKVAFEAAKGTMTANELASKYEVHPVQISQWKKELLENMGSIFDGKRPKKPAETPTDSSKLYEEIGRLKIEVDWLKKKSDQLSKM